MRSRTGLVLAAVAAATMLISACGSDPTPTPTAAAQPSTSAAAGGTADMTASSAEPSPGGADSSSATDTAEPTATDDSQTSDDTSTEDTTTTGSVTPLELDDTTTNFFATMCTGFAPLVSNELPEYDPSEPAEPQRDEQVELFTTFAQTLGSTAGQLQQIPPPTFDRGEEVAAAVISAFSKGAATASDGAAKIAAAPEAELEQTIEDAENVFDEAGDDLDAVDEVMNQPGMSEALEQIEECKPLFRM